MAVTLEEPTEARPDATGEQSLRAAARAEPIEPSVSVLIVTWNSGAWVERCLEALPAAFDGLPYEVIVHDNASSDDTVRFARAAADSRTTVLVSEVNRGFAGGLNQALRQAEGRHVLILNPDCEPAPGSLRALVEYLDRTPDASGAVPLLVDESGVPQRRFQLRRLPTLGGLAAEILLLDRVIPRNRFTSRYRYGDLDITRVHPIEQPAAAAILMRRSVVTEVGPFDERFSPAWFEDVDYSRRLALAGHSIRLVPEARAKHRGGASLEHVPFNEFLRVWYRNLFRYSGKWFSPAEVETLRWTIIAGMMLRAAASLAGLSKHSGRKVPAGTYLAVARDAFHRWEEDLTTTRASR